ncbi:Hypothetical protein AJAP_42895 (plasmid) [Amycolatopsis japonica]|uniref:Uncharacterized protein n=1 Tax=Amycolatopsis japonica TaxID=208439 RepID=A0A075VAI2_9PSEU|nr:hypothetical protein [Amycolatopsis japonica]AIG81346.1 Hypothetical protein AJAP_42895 [Amycolatopsis japonica]
MKASKWSWPVPAAPARRAPAPAGHKPAGAAEQNGAPWSTFAMSEEDALRAGLKPAVRGGTPAGHARWLISNESTAKVVEEWESTRRYLERTADGGAPSWEREAMAEFFAALDEHVTPRGGYYAFPT